MLTKIYYRILQKALLFLNQNNMTSGEAKTMVVELNSKLNIRFEKPRQEFLPGVQPLVNRMAEVIGVESIILELPENGFLAQPLTNTQKKTVNRDLGIIYAAESVAFQKKLMEVHIEESDERMVSLPDYFAQLSGASVSFSDKPFHPASENGWAGKPRVFWTREGVAQRLLSVVNALNAIDLQPHFEDAFRPVGVQEGLLKRRITQFILLEHPDWDPEKDFDLIMNEAQSKTAITPRIAGHKGGAAVDVTLRTVNGDPLPLGNDYPMGDALVNLNCPYVTANEWQTRQLFLTVMEMSGFAVYPGEDWHASYGDNLAGANPDGTLISGYQTRYGPIKNFDPNTGKVFPYDAAEYDKHFFSREELRQLAIEARK
ncbi:hypothetical protein A2774_02900 [Candidatus Roizmanbacteria bacterium RIFCSPHIGHO2_01_FULL_39_12c]|uniref:Peptidase M15B domain-containing protein n=1 Tax=Candidatus Roizmanbacteria bacterium RIFCSPHIGHO2_01_FULL_39_12c TaxID=1802031 RepID=A0A1F7GBW8_9BACT|nr:MAG: hypothetical protein A2774_02900 [Candidatus Roizmanbacteria bacterium RIFCSPHIGHO2_01_FULL_39_12c]OGK47453.1 MAG: hypothetical protein A2963_04840 [Candidatus Roizmanbacteria bacterium RIFCSPLOWO2_01_FULL_40_13]